MTHKVSPRVTNLLMAWSDGDTEALGQLMPLVCHELRLLARRSMRREESRHTLQPTALVNELFLRVSGKRSVSWQNRSQFFGFAAQEMRLILVDHARYKRRQKRGSGESPRPLEPELEQLEAPASEVDILEIHQILDRFEDVDERAATVVKLRFFVGLTIAETAAALEVSEATIKRDWETAKLWLYREMNDDSRNGSHAS